MGCVSNPESQKLDIHISFFSLIALACLIHWAAQRKWSPVGQHQWVQWGLRPLKMSLVGVRAGCGPWCLLQPSGEHKSDTEVLRLAWGRSHPLLHCPPLLLTPFLLCYQLIPVQGQTLSPCHPSPPFPKLNVHAKPTHVFKQVQFPPEVVPI